MPYEGIGARHVATATKACTHGQIVVENLFVGSAFKTQQVSRWVQPANAQAIGVSEVFEIQIGGIHEAPIAGALVGVAVGDRVFILPSTNALSFATGVTAGAANTVPVGRVTEIDSTRTVPVARINSNAWNA